jgi:putative methyltransferase (TIGR04325 family)
MRKLAMFFAEHGLFSPLPFSGIYTSFDDLPETIISVEDNLAEVAERNVSHGLKFDEASKLPRLRRARSLLPLVAALMVAKRQTSEPFRILDFGGAAGIDFANLIAAIRDTSNIRYHVVDFPKVCASGAPSGGMTRRSRFMTRCLLQPNLIWSMVGAAFITLPIHSSS